MMDLSDGLASDLRHILAASGVGAELDIECIPAYADPQEAVCAGEDYKLLLTADPCRAERLQADFRARFGKPLHPVGRITEERKLRWLLGGRPPLPRNVAPARHRGPFPTSGRSAPTAPSATERRGRFSG